MTRDEQVERLAHLTEELPTAPRQRLEELLVERRALLLRLSQRAKIDRSAVLASSKPAEEARLRWVSQRETARARIQELRQTRAALSTLRADGPGRGQRVNRLG